VLKSDALHLSKPAVMRAFTAARNAAGAPAGATGESYVERAEFRRLLYGLRSYFELFAAFNRLDTSDDRRLDLDEFKAGCALLSRWGVAIEPLEAEVTFERMDKNGGGFVLFDEFCDWAIEHRLRLEASADAPSGEAGERTLAPPPPRVSAAARGVSIPAKNMAGSAAPRSLPAPPTLSPVSHPHPHHHSLARRARRKGGLAAPHERSRSAWCNRLARWRHEQPGGLLARQRDRDAPPATRAGHSRSDGS
jgi:hypothetical protein